MLTDKYIEEIESEVCFYPDEIKEILIQGYIEYKTKQNKEQIIANLIR